jgi:hypothetical protein
MRRSVRHAVFLARKGPLTLAAPVILKTSVTHEARLRLTNLHSVRTELVEVPLFLCSRWEQDQGFD